MKNKTFILSSFLLLLAGARVTPAFAEEEHTLGILHVVELGADVRTVEGERPGAGPSGVTTYEQRSGWWWLRAGAAPGRNTTDLGSLVGFELGVAFGVTPKDTAERGSRVPLALVSHGALNVIGFTWNHPFIGYLVFTLGGELAFGGAHWWSDTPRLLPTTGVRMLGTLGHPGAVFEIEYALAPYFFGGSPGDLSVDRAEHRFSVNLDLGEVAIGGGLLLSRESSESAAFGAGGPLETSSTGFTFRFEWRQ